MAVKRQKRRAEVQFISPMKATLVSAPPQQGDWLYELKFDGFRTVAVKNGNDVRLYSRDRRDLTRQFPEVVSAFSAGAGRYVLDGEVLAMTGGRALPFQRLQQRLGRREPDRDVVAAHPVALVAFDCLAREDEGLLDAPLRSRRAVLEALSLPAGQVRAPVHTAASAAELDALFHAAQARGNEGLMVKHPDSPYASGRRGAQWLKLKRPLDTLDVVVVGAEWGHGKRRAVLSDLTFAVRDESTGALVTIGKAYNGLTDAEIREMTERLVTLTVEDHGHYRTVRPEIVLEVAFNHLQRSARHTSGYALRFPRIVRVRADRSPADASTLADVERLAATLAPASPDPDAGAGESS